MLNNTDNQSPSSSHTIPAGSPPRRDRTRPNAFSRGFTLRLTVVQPSVVSEVAVFTIPENCPQDPYISSRIVVVPRVANRNGVLIGFDNQCSAASDLGCQISTELVTEPSIAGGQLGDQTSCHPDGKVLHRWSGLFGTPQLGHVTPGRLRDLRQCGVTRQLRFRFFEGGGLRCPAMCKEVRYAEYSVHVHHRTFRRLDRSVTSGRNLSAHQLRGDRCLCCYLWRR